MDGRVIKGARHVGRPAPDAFPVDERLIDHRENVEYGDPPVRFMVGGDHLLVDDRPIDQKVIAVADALLRVVATWGAIGTLLYAFARVFLHWAGV